MGPQVVQGCGGESCVLQLSVGHKRNGLEMVLSTTCIVQREITNLHYRTTNVNICKFWRQHWKVEAKAPHEVRTTVLYYPPLNWRPSY